MQLKRLAILLTHPIQYYAPLFRLLNAQNKIDLKVFYTRKPGESNFDPDFRQQINWDIPLLEGYHYVFKPGGSSKENRLLILAVANFQPSAILVFGWNSPGHLAILRYFKGKIPVWFRGDSTLIDERPGFKLLLRRLFLTWVYRHIDLAFYVGVENQRYFKAHGLSTQHLRFAPHAIDNSRFADGAAKQYEIQAKDWRYRLGIGEQDYVVLFAGKLETKKAPELLLKAINELKQDKTLSIHLVYAGSGEQESKLRQLSLGKDNIHFIGFQNQSKMPIVYRIGDVFCLPSQGPGETWGLAVNEALACGRPVIVSNKVGCAANLVSSENNGYIFPANSVSKLKECILAVKNNYDRNIYDVSRRLLDISNWSFENQAEAITTEIYAS